MVDQSLAFERPLSTVDVVIFTVRDEALQVLLVQRHADPDDPFPGRWALPGGFIDTARDSDLTACALRKLREKTGVEAPYLEQLGSWGNAKRDPRGWSTTHVYFSLIPSNHLDLTPGGNAADSRWFIVHGDRIHQTLAFDHAVLIKAAVTRLRAKVEYTSLPAFLMPDEFTLTELQRTVEAISGRHLHKQNFRRLVETAALVEPTGETSTATGGRPAAQYRFRREVVQERPAPGLRLGGRS